MDTPKRILISEARKFLEQIKKDPKQIYSIVGPTGTGKTKLALDLATRLGPQNVLLVSVDSVAFYKKLDIGSAKPLGPEREGFCWEGLDYLDISEQATSSNFVELVMPKIQEAFSKGRYVLVVGGSHFYERALLMGRMPGEPSGADFQDKLSSFSNEQLHKKLLEFDQRFKLKIHVSDRYRITRYLDLVERQGLSFEQLMTSKDQRPWDMVYTYPILGELDLELRTKVLKNRTIQMIKAGWIEEVQELLKSGASPEDPGLKTVGYREVVGYLTNKLFSSVDELTEAIVLSHRQLAKVQRTWVRGLIKKSDTLN